MSRPRPLVWVVCVGSIVATLASAQPSVERSFATFPPALGAERSGAAVRDWMSERLDAFALEAGVDSLAVAKVEPLRGGGTRVLIRQFWHGLPVVGADARAIVSPEGVLTSLITGFASDLRAPLEPRISPDRAGALAFRAGALADASLESVTLAVARRAVGDHLVFEALHHQADGEPVRTIVDAVTGDVLEVDAGIAHAVGRVYPTDPRQPLEVRELPGLLPGTPLHAPGFAITDELYPPALPSGPDQYLYLPDDPAFDQVNTFWHVAHDLGDFYRPLGYAGPPDALIVRMHFALEPEVARTNGNFVTFGRAIAGFSREASLADDIVYHELGHAVMYGFGVQPGGPRREASALHEGLADYFAAALTGDPAIGEWAYLVFPTGATRVDMPSPPWDLAHYDQVAFAGGGPASPWANGMILSSGLWDLRLRIGAASDSLVLEALVYLPTVPTWGQFANALFLADQDHHGSRFWTTIGEVLGRRGITGAVSAQISGPDAPKLNEPVEVRALPCCGGTVGHYHWRARRLCSKQPPNSPGVRPCEAFRDVGDSEVLRMSFDDDTEVELSVVSPFGGRAVDTTTVLVRTPYLVLEGPTRVTKNAPGTWRARVAAASPWNVVFKRRWLVAGAPEDSVVPQGSPNSVTFPVQSSFQLTAELKSTYERKVIAQLQVEATAGQAPRSTREEVRLTQSLDGARTAETRVELSQATNVRVAVYDIRGRERVLLDDGGASQGERVIRWDAHVLEPGVYFVRAATTTGHSATLRFVILR